MRFDGKIGQDVYIDPAHPAGEADSYMFTEYQINANLTR